MAATVAKRIIYGTAWKKERTKDLVITAVLQGFRAIDTACQLKHYREDLVGEALQELDTKYGIKREDLWLQTKFTSLAGQDPTQPLPYTPTSPIPTQITSSFHTSLTHLHTTYLDSYILHSPLPTLPQTLEAWHTLCQLQDSGQVKLIGVSNTYDVGVLEALHAVRPVQVVQNRWYQGNGWDKGVVEFCKRNGVMYQSFWTLTGSPSLLSHPSLNKLADASHLTPAQTLYKIAQTLHGITPLSGTTDKQHMREDLAVDASTLNVQGEELQEVFQFVKDLLT